MLENTFPNITGPVVPTQLNITGPVVPTQLQLANNVPVGGIILWSGNHTDVPSGWGICDGTVYQKVDGSGPINSPNLVKRFVLANTTGGAWSHAHGNAGSTALTEAQMSWHGHAISDPGHAHCVVLRDLKPC